MEDMKLSEKVLWTKFENANNRVEVDKQIMEGIVNLEERVKELQEENKDLTNTTHEQLRVKENMVRQIKDLEEKCTKLNSTIQNLNIAIDQLNNQDYIQRLKKENEELKHDKDMINTMYADAREKIRQLEDKLKDANDKVEAIKSKRKCKTCDSWVKGVCKANADLGYEYCSEDNGYVGYRELIKEME